MLKQSSVCIGSPIEQYEDGDTDGHVGLLVATGIYSIYQLCNDAVTAKMH